jgi:hypothetical protein
VSVHQARPRGCRASGGALPGGLYQVSALRQSCASFVGSLAFRQSVNRDSRVGIGKAGAVLKLASDWATAVWVRRTVEAESAGVEDVLTLA